MRILHVIHRFLPEAVAGGTTTYLDHLCREQMGKHDVAVFSGGSPKPEGDVHERIRENGILIYKVHPNRQHWFWSEDNAFVEARFRALLDAFAPDVIHFHSIALLSNSLPEVATGLAIPTVFTLHDYWFVCLRIFPWIERSGRIVACPRPSAYHCSVCQKEGLGAAQRVNPLRAGLSSLRVLGFAGWSRPRRMQRVFRAVRRFLSPSRALKAYYAQHGFSAEKIVFSPYGIQEPGYRRQPRTDAKMLRIGYLGGAHRAKGLVTLLRAFQPFEGRAELRVYGAYPEAFTKEHASPSVVFHATVTGDGKLRELSELDLIVVPSLFPDNSPLVIHEARMMGIPVLASAIGGIEELVEEGKTGFLVAPGDAAALQERIGRFVALPSLCEELGKEINRVRTIADDAASLEAHYRAV